MNPTIHSLGAMLVMTLLTSLCPAQVEPQAKTLKLHNIFDNDMVLQRGKPIKIWGWGKPGDEVSVKFGKDTATARVDSATPVNVAGEEQTYTGKGRWEVTLPEREASAEPQILSVTSGGEKVELTNIVIGDVWVLHGQSNMRFELDRTDASDMAKMANNPNLRLFSIMGNEQASLQDDIPPEKIATKGWVVSHPDAAKDFSSIGFVFGFHIQPAVDIPVGLIQNARGDALIESMVPVHKFDEHPLAKAHADHIRQRMAGFDPQAELDKIWEQQKARAKSKGAPEPPRPELENLPASNIPGMSRSHMGSVYNGMFGVFKGLNIKGALFHQGHSNQMASAIRPELYRVLVRLMIEGWREDFNDPRLPVAVIGFNAGGETQNEENFEKLSIEGGPWIREAQRLGVADVEGDALTTFLPAYDIQVPGIHPGKKREHGWRAACWALHNVYNIENRYTRWRVAVSKIISAEPAGDTFVVKFDRGVRADDNNPILKGFSIAGEDRKFYMAHARHAGKGDEEIHVWSPLVPKPVAVRYAWANSPMGNLYRVAGHQDMPLYSFRTDDWDLPINMEQGQKALGRDQTKEMQTDAEARLEYRRMEEAKRAVEILERLKTLGK